MIINKNLIKSNINNLYFYTQIYLYIIIIIIKLISYFLSNNIQITINNIFILYMK